jgi:hypothetical protein
MDPETTLQPDSPPPPESSVTVPGQPTDGGPFADKNLDDWRWMVKEWEEGHFEEYRGLYVAVFNHKLWESSLDADLLLKYVALKYHLDPERVVVALIGAGGILRRPPPPPAADESNPPETPRDIIEMRWIYKGFKEGYLAEYVGKHIAVMNEKVIASHESLCRLHEILKENLHRDPACVVTALVD